MAAATTAERAEAIDLLRVIGAMLSDGELGFLLDESGDCGGQLRLRLMAAILDVVDPAEHVRGQELVMVGEMPD